MVHVSDQGILEMLVLVILQEPETRAPSLPKIPVSVKPSSFVCGQFFPLIVKFKLLIFEETQNSKFYKVKRR